MNGAESVARTLVVNGVEVCFSNPVLDWVSLARGHGVEGTRATTLDEFANALERAFSRRGPYLIELVI